MPFISFLIALLFLLCIQLSHFLNTFTLAHIHLPFRSPQFIHFFIMTIDQLPPRAEWYDNFMSGLTKKTKYMPYSIALGVVGKRNAHLLFLVLYP